jgi:hypothetical protein
MSRIAHITDFHLRQHLPGTSTSTKILSRHMPAILAHYLERRLPVLRRGCNAVPWSDE